MWWEISTSTCSDSLDGFLWWFIGVSSGFDCKSCLGLRHVSACSVTYIKIALVATNRFTFRIWLWVYYNETPIYPMFYLLKGDYIHVRSVCLLMLALRLHRIASFLDSWDTGKENMTTTIVYGVILGSYMDN